MDFHQLLAKMVELDRPVPEAQVIEEPNEGNEFSGALKAARDAGQDEFEVDGKKYKVNEDGTIEECPMDSMPSPMSKTPEAPAPSMSLNLNAQGMDNIESLMKLMTKVNPDMINQPTVGIPPLPTLSAPDTIASMSNLNSGPLKMLPDFDLDNDMKPGGEMDLPPDHNKDHAMVKALDKDMDGDHDMDDHDAEKKKEAFANSAGDSEPEYMDIDSVLPNGNDLNRPKKTFPKVAGGDNPMQKDAFRESIRAELQKKLNEAKGVK